LSQTHEAGFDRWRAFGPSVLEDADGGLLMWYSGHDGSTARILAACQPCGRSWQRLGVAIDAGCAGDTDAYGVESPSVVRTVGGLLMAYAGSDGGDTRLHMATSVDGLRWSGHGTFLQRGAPDAVGATHPCLVVTGSRWWLFYSGYDGSRNGRAAAILAAVSDNGASWDRLGPVLEPGEGELAVTEPCVLVTRRRFVMLHAVEDEVGVAIELAMSVDGMSWQRQGRLRPDDDDVPDVRSPCALRLHDHTVRLWYAARDRADDADAYRLRVTDCLGPAW
jgi:predicted GH43/DUF377 family glycosyl hydrolase